MKKKYVIVFVYLLLALGFAGNGLFMILSPSAWFQAVPLPVVKGMAPVYHIQLLGMADLAMAPLFLWCARNLKRRKPIHLVLTLYTVGVALVSALEIAVQPVMPADASFWLPMLLLVFLPALIMLVMALPPLPARVKGPREQGRVKWFNATKGFGFIQPEGGGPDAFVHISAVEAAGLSTLNEGQRVQYELVQGQRGKSSAENLKLVS